MSGWIKIVLVYSVAAAAAFGRLAHGAVHENGTFTANQLNLSGDYANRPLLGDVYFHPAHYRGEFPRLWIQLAALKSARTQAVGKTETAVTAELNTLRSEHRSLMNNRNGVGKMDDSEERQSQESVWSMALTHNVTRQASLKAKWGETVGRWDRAHELVAHFATRSGKKFLVRLELPKPPQDTQVAVRQSY